MSIVPRASLLPVVTYDLRRIAEDIAGRTWSVRDAARVSGIGYRTLYRFLNGARVNSITITKLCKALGTIPETYIVRQVIPEPPAFPSAPTSDNRRQGERRDGDRRHGERRQTERCA